MTFYPPAADPARTADLSRDANPPHAAPLIPSPRAPMDWSALPPAPPPPLLPDDEVLEYPDPTEGLTDAEAAAYWRGARETARAMREAADTAREYDRGRAAARIAADAAPRLFADLEARTANLRHDGWTPARRREFLEALATSGVVVDACRAVGLSAKSAYRLRNRDRAFGESWTAALALARQRLADELYERALRGQVDRVIRDGEVVAERHRHDNRLAMAILARLDRQQDNDYQIGPFPQAPHAALADRWANHLDSLAPEADPEAAPESSGETPSEPPPKSASKIKRAPADQGHSV